jgi:hypothetical protein
MRRRVCGIFAFIACAVLSCGLRIRLPNIIKRRYCSLLRQEQPLCLPASRTQVMKSYKSFTYKPSHRMSPARDHVLKGDFEQKRTIESADHGYNHLSDFSIRNDHQSATSEDTPCRPRPEQARDPGEAYIPLIADRGGEDNGIPFPVTTSRLSPRPRAHKSISAPDRRTWRMRSRWPPIFRISVSPERRTCPSLICWMLALVLSVFLVAM